MKEQLELKDLVAGLTSHGTRFAELHVFADDVAELRALKENRPVPELEALGDDSFRFQHAGETFLLALSSAGVARLYRPAPGQRTDNRATGAILGSVAGSAVGAALDKKGEGWAVGLVLGLLIGAALGADSTGTPPKRVLTMRFDPQTQSWCAYDGGLVTWMKTELQAG